MNNKKNSPSDAPFVRVTAASHPTAIADPQANVGSTLLALKKYEDSNIVVFGELSLSGYSCGDLFAQEQLLESSLDALEHLANATSELNQAVVVGLPIRVSGKLYNAAALIAKGELLGIVPKQYLPNYGEFYEARWFAAADGSEPESINLPFADDIPFGIDLLFEWNGLVVGIELCEDLWMPIPPSSLQAAAGANLLVNLSASNELVGKADWREVLVRSQSGRCLAAYAYASAGPSESTTDLVFGGQCLVAENGVILAKSHRVGQPGCAWIEHTNASADIDLQKLTHDRQVTVSWQQATKRSALEFRRIPISLPRTCDGSLRRVNATPFVPKNNLDLHSRCSEIFGIQCAALTKRVSRLPSDLTLNIGVSGGLDSTLALLVAVKTCQHQGWPTSRICGMTMPGFGTTSQTLTTARDLMRLLNVSGHETDIRQLCIDTYIGMDHKPFGIDVCDLSVDEFVARLSQLKSEQLKDLVFENVQARVRTLLLMSRGFVLGTGDLSEQALGWSTYNGDHMSMYNVNTSVPKTLVKFLVKYVAEQEFDGEVRDCLLKVVNTPISPELLPPDKEGKIDQLTESAIGPYELHDFFLYNMIRYGSKPNRLLELAALADFSQDFTQEEIQRTLRTFLERFFANQFKRSCVPDGPKVGSVSLSPRGDWRMPSDAEAAAWLRELDDV